MHPPDIVAPGPSYSALFARSAFAQWHFMNEREFVKEASTRGVRLGQMMGAPLEALDCAGLLSPVAFSQTNYTVETTWLDPDPDYMRWREELNFQPWREHGWISDVSGSRWVSEKYSPWQLLYAQDAAGMFADGVVRGSLDEAWRPMIKLLSALQARLWPYRTGSVTLLVRSGQGPPERVDPLAIEVERFDAREVLHQFELGVDELARLHAELCDASRRVDPTPSWYRLVELAPRQQTDTLRDAAMQARDLRDASYVVRQFFHLFTDKWLPLADRMDHPDVKGFQRRHLPNRCADGDDGPAIDLQVTLEGLGLYPHQIHFVVEGFTEDIILKRLLELLALGSGYQVTNVEGVDKTKKHQALISAASQYASRLVLIADQEGSLASILGELQKVGLLTNPDDLLLWEAEGQPATFEEANFSVDEIVAAMTEAALKRQSGLTVHLTGNALRQKFAEERARASAEGRPRPALAKLALKLAEEEAIRVSKLELAYALANLTARLIEDAGTLHDAATVDRPLLARFWTWIASTPR